MLLACVMCRGPEQMMSKQLRQLFAHHLFRSSAHDTCKQHECKPPCTAVHLCTILASVQGKYSELLLTKSEQTECAMPPVHWLCIQRMDGCLSSNKCTCRLAQPKKDRAQLCRPSSHIAVRPNNLRKWKPHLHTCHLIVQQLCLSLYAIRQSLVRHKLCVAPRRTQLQQLPTLGWTCLSVEIPKWLTRQLSLR